MKLYIILFVIVAVVKNVFSATGYGIAATARGHIGSRTWLYSASYKTGANTNKCNIFVADVLKTEDADAPNRRPFVSIFFDTPIGANEWGNPNSSYLKNAKCWDLCSGQKRSGDVIAEGGHVGIVTGARKTTSASAAASPQGLIVENDWGFRSGQNPTCWRYKYYTSGC